MNVKFLYWNINKSASPFEDEIDFLVKSKNIEVLALAENDEINISTIEQKTNLRHVKLHIKSKAKNWVQLYYNESKGVKISHVGTDGYDDEGRERAINRIQLFKITGDFEDTYFACIHFPSKLYHDENTQLQLVRVYKSKIHKLMQVNKSDRLFIFGDFNMNPFDSGMTDPTAFFAHQNRSLITQDQKIVFQQNCHLYYNPSWTLFGDFINTKSYKQSRRNGGSYYYNSKKSRNIFWNIFDQIIMRKSIIDEFCSESLDLVDSINKNYSIDHMALCFSFNFK